MFDYVLTGGSGLDTPQGARERGAVLQFIGKHFCLEQGTLVATASLGPTVCRRLLASLTEQHRQQKPGDH